MDRDYSPALGTGKPVSAPCYATASPQCLGQVTCATICKGIHDFPAPPAHKGNEQHCLISRGAAVEEDVPYLQLARQAGISESSRRLGSVGIILLKWKQCCPPVPGYPTSLARAERARGTSASLIWFLSAQHPGVRKQLGSQWDA